MSYPHSRAGAPVLLFSLALALAARADEDYSQWAHSRELWTNTSPDGAYVTSTVRRFPVLVRLDSTRFPFSEARGKGEDLRFTNLAGKRLPHQIERWDSTGARAEIWVLADSIVGNGYNKSLRMLWGKSDAADSSNGAGVFDSSEGWTAVWHLGGADTLARPNAVAGGNPATPKNYDGDESRAGAIGWADSLDGAPQGDYLDLGPGYADFSKGLTFSVWARPDAAAFWARILDMGNGQGQDNFVLQRHLSDENLIWDQYNGTAGNTRVEAKQVLALGVWQLFTVSVANKVCNIYKNGALVATGTQHDTIAIAAKTTNFIGKSNWPGNSYYRGGIDEPRLSRVARNADWVKLEYANQRADQTLLLYSAPAPVCAARFAAPKDTVLPEGSPLVLAGIADCADSYGWEVISGPAPRILDPERKDLQLVLPRATKDYALRYRFTANYPTSVASAEVVVSVLEAIPDPAFTMPANFTWNGKDSVLITPKLSNLAAIKASRDSVLNWSWSLVDMETDTAWRDNALLLQAAHASGVLKLALCLDNNGPVTCKSMAITVEASSGLPSAHSTRSDATRVRGYDARGRSLGAGSPHGTWWRALPVFGFFR